MGVGVGLWCRGRRGGSWSLIGVTLSLSNLAKMKSSEVFSGVFPSNKHLSSESTKSTVFKSCSMKGLNRNQYLRELMNRALMEALGRKRSKWAFDPGGEVPSHPTSQP